jgi:hypothetical protein
MIKPKIGDRIIVNYPEWEDDWAFVEARVVSSEENGIPAEKEPFIQVLFGGDMFFIRRVSDNEKGMVAIENIVEVLV